MPDINDDRTGKHLPTWTLEFVGAVGAVIASVASLTELDARLIDASEL
jgi:hypothetical protein